jgi:hypothetical protein
MLDNLRLVWLWHYSSNYLVNTPRLEKKSIRHACILIFSTNKTFICKFLKLKKEISEIRIF